MYLYHRIPLCDAGEEMLLSTKFIFYRDLYFLQSQELTIEPSLQEFKFGKDCCLGKQNFLMCVIKSVNVSRCCRTVCLSH